MNTTTHLGMLHNVFDSLDEALSSGDPHVREWFLIKNNFWPLFLCSMYFITVRKIGPALMKDRKPFDLRNIMIVYNLCLVVVYTICVSIVVYLMVITDSSILCKDTVVTRKNSTYMMVTCGWIIYLLKYVEFMDTIFFVLRKKNNLITNLHVIHHTVLPLCGWILFRTEKSGFQAYPVITNSIVHIFMYSYYGLAAMGPSVRKYLWWKRYLTLMQMTQFILILIFVVVVMPMMGCTSTKTSVIINITAAIVFFALFYNFYQHTFKQNKVSAKATAAVVETNGAVIKEKSS